jgi:hypothetical protein
VGRLLGFGLLLVLAAACEQNGLHLTWSLQFNGANVHCADLGRATQVRIRDSSGLGVDESSFDCDDYEATYEPSSFGAEATYSVEVTLVSDDLLVDYGYATTVHHAADTRTELGSAVFDVGKPCSISWGIYRDTTGLECSEVGATRVRATISSARGTTDTYELRCTDLGGALGDRIFGEYDIAATLIDGSDATLATTSQHLVTAPDCHAIFAFQAP